jgi:hypothetical protein
LQLNFFLSECRARQAKQQACANCDVCFFHGYLVRGFSCWWSSPEVFLQASREGRAFYTRLEVFHLR